MKTRTATEATQFLKKAATIASYYGFVPVDVLFNEYGQKYGTVTKSTPPFISPIPGDRVSEALSQIASRVAVVALKAEDVLSPRFFYHWESKIAPSVNTSNLHFTLGALGISKSIAEAVIVKTALAILEENGESETSVHINSMGDTDSGIKFVREAGAHLKKNAGTMPAPAREALKSDIFRALAHLVKKNHPSYEDVPKPMEFLGDKSRQHFSEFIEYLETVAIPYEIDNRIIGHDRCYRETVFEIRNKGEDGEDNVICRGGRADELLRACILRKDVSLVGGTIHLSFHGNTSPTLPNRRTKKPDVCLIQVGLPARMKSLSIIETLRKEHIPLAISFELEGLRDQLDHANALSIPHAIIIGQREALDGSAIIRNLDTQAQETIPLAFLPQHLKTLS